MALKEKYDVVADEKAVLKKGEKILNYWSRMKKHKLPAYVIIREPYPVVFGRNSKDAKLVAVIHHIDDLLQKKSLKHQWYFRRLKKKS